MVPCRIFLFIVMVVSVMGCGHSTLSDTEVVEGKPPASNEPLPTPVVSPGQGELSCPAHPDRFSAGLVAEEPKPPVVAKPTLTHGTFVTEVYLEERRGPVLSAKQGNNHLRFSFHSVDETITVEFCARPDCACEESGKSCRSDYITPLVVQSRHFLPLKTWVPLRLAWEITKEEATLWLFLNDVFYWVSRSPGLTVGDNPPFEELTVGGLKGEIRRQEFLDRPWLKNFSESKTAQQNCVDPILGTDPKVATGLTAFAGRQAWNRDSSKLLLSIDNGYGVLDVATKTVAPLAILGERYFWGPKDHLYFLNHGARAGNGGPLPPLLVMDFDPLQKTPPREVARIEGVTSPPVTSYGLTDKNELILIAADSCDPQSGNYAATLCNADPLADQKGWRVAMNFGSVLPTAIPKIDDLQHPLWAEFPYRGHAHGARSPDGKWVAIAGEPGVVGVILQNVADRTKKLIFPGGLVNHISWGPTSEWFVVSSSNHSQSADKKYETISFDANQLWQVWIGGRYRSLSFINTSERRFTANAIPQVSPKGDLVAYTSDDCHRDLPEKERTECVYLINVPPTN